MPSVRRAAASTTADELKVLKALRIELAGHFEACGSDRDRAALAGRILDVGKRITELEARAPAVRSPLDEIAARRTRRRPIRNGVKREEA